MSEDDVKRLLAEATPGPWVFAEENVGLMPDHGYGILHGEPGAGGWEKNLYVTVGCSHNAARELGLNACEANARLIAAAPTIAAAYIEQAATIARLTEERDRLREALELLVRDVADYGAWQRPCLALDRARAALAAMGVGR